MSVQSMANDFGEQYKATVASLIGALPPGCGVPEASLAAAEARLGIRLRAALRDYYLSVGGVQELNAAHNRLLAPEDWFLDSGRLAFMVENQAVVYWGVSAIEALDDPPVLQGVNLLPDSIEWHPEHDRCSEFLLVMLHWQAVCGGFEWSGMADVGRRTPKALEKHWRPVGLVSGMLAFGGQGRAACIIGEDDDRQLYVGARTEKDFEQIASELRRSGLRVDVL